MKLKFIAEGYWTLAPGKYPNSILKVTPNKPKRHSPLIKPSDREKFIRWGGKKPLNESMNVYVKGYDFSDDIYSLFDLSAWLQRKTAFKLWDGLTSEQQEAVRKSSMPGSIITPDGEDNGIINFYTGGWPKEFRDEILKQITSLLDSKNIKHAPFRSEESGLGLGEVIRIPIIDFSPTKGTPPELNLANSNAVLVFRDVLGFDSDNQEQDQDRGPDPFLDSELVFSSLDAVDVYARTQKVLTNPDIMQLHQRDAYSQQTPGSARAFTGSYDVNSLRRTLTTIGKIAKWAIDNGYSKLGVY